MDTSDIKKMRKGQLFSKCLYGVIVFDQKTKENIVRISALKHFKASFGLPVGFLINGITY